MSVKITRRRAITAGLAASAASCAPRRQKSHYEADIEGASAPFIHGIAAGDPGAASLVIWTRISLSDPSAANAGIAVEWECAGDEDFTEPLARGAARTSAARDWTVKALASGLPAGRTIYYRFRLGEALSPIGRARTLPRGAIESVRFAVVSCSNYPFGYFNVYDLIARRDDLDAVIHLGDYIYEYGRDAYGGETGARLQRNHEPAHETITLADYRMRHAQYKADPASQAMHARHALIPVWDDHEVADNSWANGSENHDLTSEGDWAARKRAALQAYFEWMPVREPAMAPEAFFRAYSFGDLLTLTMLETRLMAREQPFDFNEIAKSIITPEDLDGFTKNVLWNESRQLLGPAQTDFIARTVSRSIAEGQPWRLFANQVIMARVAAPDLTTRVTEEDMVELERQWDQARGFVDSSIWRLPANVDAWDGYPAARERFYDMLKAAGEDGLIVVTGDTHTWWANDLTDRAGAHMGVELGTHSVTSPSTYDKSFLGGKGAEYALLTNQENKDVRYLSGEDHGFIDLEITHKGARGEFRAVDTIESPSYNAFTKAAFEIAKSKKGAIFTDADGLSFKEGFLF